MITTLRTRLLIGIAPLLAIVVALGLWAVVMFWRLGGNIDVILRENYKSVLAAERMKEALERLDSALLFALNGEEARAHEQFRKYRPEFETSLDIELHNITLPGEGQKADDLAAYYRRYIDLAGRFFGRPTADVEWRRRLYFREILPLFNRIKDRADDVLLLNQRNMEEMDRKARAAASGAVRGMVAALVGSAVVASLIALLLSRSILGPIRAVTDAARAMAEGDLEQVVPVRSRDELGELAAAFNSMARTIRAFQQAGTARLVRAQRTAQATIDSFPDPVVVVDPAGAVERANPAARRLLGVHPVDGAAVSWDAPEPLGTHLADVLKGGSDYRPTGFEHAVFFREDGQERHLLPRVLAIRDEQGGMIGAAVVLNDVTRFRILDQLKSDMVATVSHELKTPLTSIQMAVHLLLEEVVGPLSPKQLDLLLAARQDSDRLLAMVNDLLDLTRIEQGSVRLDLKPVAAAELVAEAVDRFADRAHDLGIALEDRAERGLPEVLVDRDRITHVFDNLIENALAHTERGGSVRVGVGAAAGVGALRFTVADDGEGIAAEHLTRIFDRFYRVPGSRSARGAGLGLAIAREVVLAHGGQIDVASAPGAGTTFTITLPAAPSGDGKGAP
ncbi:MAG TPA: ATP-binding protein [Isosphaeraceae bacterium]|jgi:PAS domain S-box-containing protein|nr:ATP-binding protein [Isosphaeraceae bacterium]